MTAELPVFCAEQNVLLALSERRATDLLPCLRRCFEGFRRSIFNQPATPEVLEDIFWEAAFALDRKSKRQDISLTTSLCGYFRGFVHNYWKSWLSAKAKNPIANLLDDTDIDLPDDDLPVTTQMLDQEKETALLRCLSKLDERSQTIIKNYFSEKTDRETAAELHIENWRNISVMRARCFEKLRQLLKTNYPDLLDFKF
ncbi:MAG: sigma-70 family RNA polymerase sigma factor [Bacteroidota bacterium]